MDENQRIKKLETKLHALIFLLILVLAGGSFVFLPSLKNAAFALTGNYSKTDGDSLEISDWNNLKNDFLDKSGDAMLGDLDMNGGKVQNIADASTAKEAVNVDVMNTAISNAVSGIGGSVEDIGGNSAKFVCSYEYINAINTVQYDSITLHMTIDTSAAGLAGNVMYFTSISGDGSHYKLFGENAIYGITGPFANPVYPVTDGFDLYLKFYDYNNSNGGVVSLADAMNWNWRVNWCGFGQ